MTDELRHDDPVLDPGPAPLDKPRPTPCRSLSAGLLTGLIAAAVVLAVGVVWAVGGFEKRRDLLTEIAPGTTITTGPYTFSFSEITAQRTTDYADRVVWELIALGTGASTDTETGAPDYDDSGSFVSRDVASGEVQVPKSIGFGDETTRTDFTPGLPPVPFTVTFAYPEAYQPQPTLQFVVFDLEQYDNALLGEGEEEWHSTGQGYSMNLPVRVLPERTS